MGTNTNYEYQIFIQTEEGIYPFYKVDANDCLSEALEPEVEEISKNYELSFEKWLQIYNRIMNWIVNDNNDIDLIEEEIDRYKDFIKQSSSESEIESFKIICEFMSKRYAEIHEIKSRIKELEKTAAFIERMSEVEWQRRQYYTYLDGDFEEDYKPLFSVMRAFEI